MNPTDTNQASEVEQAMQHICQRTGEHYYASESIPGGLIHWIRICMTCGHKDDGDLNEQVKTLLRNEKLKLLAEVRERVVGEDEKLVIPDYPKTDDEGEPLYSKRAAKEGRKQVTARYHTRKELRNDQRTELTKLEAEL